jgi:hypothetical protein
VFVGEREAVDDLEIEIAHFLPSFPVTAL